MWCPPAGERRPWRSCASAQRPRSPPHGARPCSSLLERLPLTPNGKVDRRALASCADPAPTWREYVAPETALESELCRLWGEALRAPRLGAGDNVFNLGGNSFAMAQVHRQAQLFLRASSPCWTW